MGLLLCLLSFTARGQELFVYTEPASNMPAQSVGLRLNNWLMRETDGGRLNYHLLPEAMWGVNKNLMLHAEAFLSNRAGSSMTVEGGSLYGKYRFFTQDAMYRHFRMAVYGRVSFNNADIHQDEIMINGHNSGYEGGLILTQLLHKQQVAERDLPQGRLRRGWAHAAQAALRQDEAPARGQRRRDHELSTGAVGGAVAASSAVRIGGGS